jgi:putative sterol carrier protein
MAYEVFSDEWAREWRGKINENQTYKDNALDWDWPLILKMSAESGDNEDRAVYVDLKHGECLSGRTATPEDFDHAPYILTADAATWKKVFDGNLDILTGIMWGKVKLEKGNLGEIAKHVSAAKQLLVSAIQVDTTFPEEA